MREEGRGSWGRGGFDNELETNFISMQACCLSRRAQTEFPGRPAGESGREGGRGGVGVTEKTRPLWHPGLPPPASSRYWDPSPGNQPSSGSPSSENKIIYLPL